MAIQRVMFLLLTFTLTATVFSSYQVSARRLAEDADLGTRTPGQSEPFDDAVVQEIAKEVHPSSYQTTEFKNLEEIDRLKLSINKLICDSMEDGCDQMEDAADHVEMENHHHESFASLNPHDHVKEY